MQRRTCVRTKRIKYVWELLLIICTWIRSGMTRKLFSGGRTAVIKVRRHILHVCKLQHF
jgi:hypothetical protein